MDKGTKIRTAIALAVAILDFLAVFCFVVTPFGKVVLFALSIIVACVLGYFNNCTSKANCEHTGEMRVEKAIKKKAKKGLTVIGENFDDMADEIEEVV